MLTVIDDDQEEDVQMTSEDELVEGDDTADDDDCPNIFDIIDNLLIEGNIHDILCRKKCFLL